MPRDPHGETLTLIVSLGVPTQPLQTSAGQTCGGGTHGKQHVLFVLVDGSGIRNRVGVFDDRHRLPLTRTRTLQRS